MDTREQEFSTNDVELNGDLLAEAIQLLSEKQVALQALIHIAQKRCAYYDKVLAEINQKRGQGYQSRNQQLQYDGLVQQRNQTEQDARRLNTALMQIEQAIDWLTRAGSLGDSDTINQARILQAHEDERARLARELHDGPAQVVSNAVFQLEACVRQVDMQPERIRETLIQLSRDLRQSMTEVRGLIANLRRPSGLDLGLGVALHHYIHEYSKRFNIAVSMDLATLDAPLPDAVALAIFRIVQEALQNVRKHAEATSVDVSALLANGSLIIQVRDDGCGFDPAQVQSRGGRQIGLSSMRERANLIHGVLEIQSALNKGTKIILRVPHESVGA